MLEPDMVEIASGWAAIHNVPGNKWAVHAATKEEALRLYSEGVEKRQKIAERPYNFELLVSQQHQQLHTGAA